MASQSGSPVFDSMAEDFTELLQAMSKKISALQAKSVADRGKVASEVSGQFAEANGQLKSLETELRGVNPQFMVKCKQIMSQFRSDLASQKKDFARIQEDVNREIMFTVSDGVSADQRGRLVNNTQRAAKGTALLEDARRTLVDTEQEGIQVLTDVKRQGELITKIGEGLNEADSIYGKVKNVIARMSRREIYMALLWVFIGLMLIAAIVLIIYFKFVKKPQT